MVGVRARVLVGGLVAGPRLAPLIAAPLTHACVGVLASGALVPAVDRAFSLPVSLYLLLFAAVACVLAWVHGRRPPVRRFVRLTALGTVAVTAWFLLLSSVSTLVLPAVARGSARARADANVLLVIFDELALGPLLDVDGTINERRFPSFAKLAASSTWYRRAETVSPWTHLAVPAILSGKMPAKEATTADYSRNLFSMLGATHELVPDELVTQLCREETCGTRPDLPTLFDDAFIIYSHTVLPDGMATRWLPEVGDRWAGLRTEEQDSPVIKDDRLPRPDEPQRFANLLDSVKQPRRRPAAWVTHMRLPHLPMSYDPDGRALNDPKVIPGLTDFKSWDGDDATSGVGRQRYLLQVKYVDKLVGDLLTTLEESGTFDDTMVVVVSDHGLTFTPGHRRGVPSTPTNAPDVLPVPLFVKYPGQREGVIDDRQVQSFDILPTIADALDVSLADDWTFDGRSLMGADPGPRRPSRYIERSEVITGRPPSDPLDAAAAYRSSFETYRSRHDVYAWGPHHALVGTQAPESAEVAAEARVVKPVSTTVTSRTPLVPAFIQLQLDDAVGEDWIAVAWNGTIAGLGRTYTDEAGDMAMAVTDPTFLQAGDNELRAFVVSADGSLREIRLQPRAG